MIEPGGPRTLVQCVGSPYLRDDGVGLYVADALSRRIRSPDVDVESHWGEGTRLMARWPGRRRVYIVDAARSGAPAGTLHRIDARRASVAADLLFHSTHRFGVAEAVEMARSLGELPDTLRLYAVEGEDFSPGEGLSAAVEDAARQLLDELTRILDATDPGVDH